MQCNIGFCLLLQNLGSCLWEKNLIRTFGFWFFLACHQAIFFVFLSGFGFPFVVRIVVLAFLKCWASIALALVSSKMITLFFKM